MPKCDYCHKTLEKDDPDRECDVKHDNLHHHCMLRMLDI
jgi:hypothetical protein